MEQERRDHRVVGADPSRREFVTAAAVSAAGLALPTSLVEAIEPATAKTPSAGAASARPTVSAAIRLGVASYSFRELSRADAIAAIVALRARYVNIKSVHLPYESTPAQLAAGRKEFTDAGLTIDGGGVIYLQKDEDDDVRAYFEYAKGAGMPLMVIGTMPAILPRIERFVRQYGIPVAIHNHGPEDQHFPAPHDALVAIRGMDARIGVCVDLGHTARTGANVVEALAEAGDRLLDVHAKDLKDLRVAESQCVVGEGAMPIAAIFRQLVAMGYTGTVDLEYEIDATDPLPGMQRSFAYMRGVLNGLGIAEG